MAGTFSPLTGAVYIFNLIVGTGALALPAAFEGIVAPDRELIPPITAFLEEDLKLVHTGCNLTPGNGVGSRPSFWTPT